VSASLLALATISSASCLARSRRASRSLSALADFASYSAFSASASLRSDSASASWSRISAILVSSALPIAAGTFFQTRMAITTMIAMEIAIGAVRKPNAAASASCPGASVVAVVCGSDIQFALHGLGSVLGVDCKTGETSDHFLGQLGGCAFDLGARGLHGLANLPFGCFDLEVDLVCRGPNLGFSLARTGLLGFIRQLCRLGARGIHPFAPLCLGLVGSSTSG